MRKLLPLLLALPLTAPAQTLSNSVHLALQHHPLLSAARAEARAADESAAAQAARLQPRLDLNAEIGRSSLQTPGFFPESGARWPNSLGLSLSKPLYSGGVLEAERDRAARTAAARRLGVDDVRVRIAVEAIAAHAAVVRDSALLDVRAESLRTLQGMLHDTGKRFMAGEVTRTEVAQAQARVSEGEASLARAGADLAISQSQYRRITGELPEGLQTRYPPLPLPATLDEAVTLAHRHPALQAAREDWQAREDAVRAALGGHRPLISVAARAATQDNTEFGYDRLSTWGVYLQAQLNLADAGLSDRQLGAARAAAEAARWHLVDQEQAQTQAMSAAWQHWQAAKAGLPAVQSEVRAAELARDSTRKELAVGTRATLDLLNAERDLLAARISLLLHEQELSLSAYQILAVIGDLSVLENPTPEAAP